MERSITPVCIASVTLAATTLALRWIQFRQPQPFESAYAAASAMTLIAFLVTWAYLVVTILMVRPQRRWAWVYVWMALSSIFAAWFLMGLTNVLVPRWPR